MKSVGERIRQARNARKMSGEYLAQRVGYKNQSAIGNLENRAGGTGGSRIGQIADVLCVPVDWLLRGPDGDDVPYIQAGQGEQKESQKTSEAGVALPAYLADSIQKEAIDLLSKMSPIGREQSISYLRFMAVQHAAHSPSAGGECDSIPHQKAA